MEKVLINFLVRFSAWGSVISFTFSFLRRTFAQFFKLAKSSFGKPRKLALGRNGLIRCPSLCEVYPLINTLNLFVGQSMVLNGGAQIENLLHCLGIIPRILVSWFFFLTETIFLLNCRLPVDRCFVVLGKISHKTESESATMGQLLTGVVCLLFLRTFVRVAADHNDSRTVYRCSVFLQCKENLHRT